MANTNRAQTLAASQAEVVIRPVEASDLEALYALETASFETDRLSRRRLKHWIGAGNREFLVAASGNDIVGYGLVLFPRGTRLARMYSIAVSEKARGTGLGKRLMQALETATANRGRLYMRLEVAQDNAAAIALYQSLGYHAFGTYPDYYEDHRDALRMQKRIRYVPENLLTRQVPWYQQTTDFTCGPAALMMAMAAFDPQLELNQELELDLWREATTIFMTAGHGGCHPVGLALAAHRRGYQSQVYINRPGPLFVESVRTAEKKHVVELVHHQFLNRAAKTGVPVNYKEVTQSHIEQWLGRGALVVILISTYRLDRKRARHWVTITAIDDRCLYMHDPDPAESEQTPFDCQYVPIAREDFDKMSVFGRERLRTAIVIEPGDGR